MRRMMTPIRWAALFTLAAASLALAAAFASEIWGGLVPCALCLVERWPYRIAVAIGVFALALPARPGAPARVARAAVALAGFVFLAGAGIAFVHVGVEQGWWPSPLPECAAPTFHPGSIEERLREMPARPAKPCDDPTYLIPVLPVSMAAMNMIYGLAAGGLLLAAAARMQERPR